MSSPSTPAWIGLGSNLGDRLANLIRAREELVGAGLDEEAASGVYETVPVGPIAQDNFLNQIVRCRGDRSPRDLLRVLKDIERRMGRSAGPKWGPRIIDLDILLLGEGGHDELCEPGLVIPHAETLVREFVLVPLAELEPDLLLPKVNKRASELLPSPHLVKKMVWPFKAASKTSE